MGVARLSDMPVEWSRQYEMRGLPPEKLHIRTESLPNLARVRCTYPRHSGY
jgi:hypothetical protein